MRALGKLLRRGGRIAFTTIHVGPNLSGAERRRAHRSGPRAVASRLSQRELMEAAGFVDVDELDVTDLFIATARAWIRERACHRDALAPLEARCVRSAASRSSRPA